MSVYFFFAKMITHTFVSLDIVKMDILRSVKTATLRNRFDSHKKDPCKITKDVRFFVQNKSSDIF